MAAEPADPYTFRHRTEDPAGRNTSFGRVFRFTLSTSPGAANPRTFPMFMDLYRARVHPIICREIRPLRRATTSGPRLICKRNGPARALRGIRSSTRIALRTNPAVGTTYL